MKKRKIIFPYKYDENGIVHYSIEEFEERYPGATEYLMSFRDELDERKR